MEFRLKQAYWAQEGSLNMARTPQPCLNVKNY